MVVKDKPAKDSGRRTSWFGKEKLTAMDLQKFINQSKATSSTTCATQDVFGVALAKVVCCAPCGWGDVQAELNILCGELGAGNNNFSIVGCGRRLLKESCIYLIEARFFTVEDDPDIEEGGFCHGEVRKCKFIGTEGEFRTLLKSVKTTRTTLASINDMLRFNQDSAEEDMS
eukprot:TRINITY_DN97466_c0_g1_i1.p1 TRINITY_DN97466_c0_g1~~TRINITY_DN97466_c0_g1_i1.p1  ORF type:complete len:172 (+),score=42.17 TRINITY_DN97466_c0_g1_i1:52-567(+)